MGRFSDVIWYDLSELMFIMGTYLSFTILKKVGYGNKFLLKSPLFAEWEFLYFSFLRAPCNENSERFARF